MSLSSFVERTNRVLHIRNTVQAQVKDGEGREHVVNFETEDCTCNMWQ